MNKGWQPPPRDIQTVGEAVFSPGDPHYKMITFLNQSLKDHNYIFGLKKNNQGQYIWSIYRLVTEEKD
ncbi:MAG: DUF4264 family protein [Limnochordia bacterium]|jgi:hypothetical protein